MSRRMIRAYDDNGNVVDLVEYEARIRAEERGKHFKAIMEFINTPNRGKCDYFIVDQIEDYIMARMREGEQDAKDNG